MAKAFKETKHEKELRVKKIIRLFQKHNPNADCALVHNNPWELLVATILSAQCTDARVNMVTPKLFATFPTPKEMAKAKVEKIEELIRSTGFYHNKAINIKATAEILVTEYKGEVPQNMEALVALKGVGRKTANVVLGNAFQIASGVVVDTHVTRLSNRLGLTKNKDAVKIEKDLNQLVPKEHWIQFSHWLILHGRSICTARIAYCDGCYLNALCPKIL